VDHKLEGCHLPSRRNLKRDRPWTKINQGREKTLNASIHRKGTRKQREMDSTVKKVDFKSVFKIN
jgi:hypothetical protein